MEDRARRVDQSLNEDEKMDPDIPFKLDIVTVSQQPNTYDCGMYAIKFVQSLAMKTNLNALDAKQFLAFRKKLAIDLVKWSKNVEGDCAYTQLEIKQ